MAYTIVATCTACGACLDACPIDAITVGDPIYVIDQEGCCDFEDCLVTCPVAAIVPSEGGAAASQPGALKLGAAAPGRSVPAA